MNKEAVIGKSTMSPAMKEAENYHAYLFEQLQTAMGSKVFEIGIGNGQYTEKMLAGRREVFGIDIDQGFVNEAKQRFPDCSDHFKVCDVNELDTLKELIQVFDPTSVFFANVMEHIENDEAFMRKIHESVKPETKALIIVPAIQVLYNRMDKEAGHFRRYSRKSMNTLLEKTGWECERNDYINSPGIFGWILAGMISGKSEENSSLAHPATNNLIRLYDRYMVAVSRFFDPLLRRAAGLSLCVVAKKKEK